MVIVNSGITSYSHIYPQYRAHSNPFQERKSICVRCIFRVNPIVTTLKQVSTVHVPDACSDENSNWRQLVPSPPPSSFFSSSSPSSAPDSTSHFENIMTDMYMYTPENYDTYQYILPIGKLRHISIHITHPIWSLALA